MLHARARARARACRAAAAVARAPQPVLYATPRAPCALASSCVRSIMYRDSVFSVQGGVPRVVAWLMLRGVALPPEVGSWVVLSGRARVADMYRLW